MIIHLTTRDLAAGLAPISVPNTRLLTPWARVSSFIIRARPVPGNSRHLDSPSRSRDRHNPPKTWGLIQSGRIEEGLRRIGEDYCSQGGPRIGRSKLVDVVDAH